jgi:hypothetical protein
MKGVAPADVPLNFLAKAIRAEKAEAFSKRQVFPYNLPTFSEEETGFDPRGLRLPCGVHSSRAGL